MSCGHTPIVRRLTRLMRATINPGCRQLNDEDPDESWPKFEYCLITRVNYFHPFRPTEPFSSGNDHRHFVFVVELKPEIWDYIYIYSTKYSYRCYFIELIAGKEDSIDCYIINRVHSNEWMKHFNDWLIEFHWIRTGELILIDFLWLLIMEFVARFWSTFDRWWELSWYKCVWRGRKYGM